MTAAAQRRMVDEMLDAGLQKCSPGDEMALLGAMMTADPASGIAAHVRNRLTPKNPELGNGRHHFITMRNQLIWDTVIELMDAGEPYDAHVVAARMDAATLQRIGGVPYLVDCMQACLSVGSAGAYARDVVNATLLRDLAGMAAKTAQAVLAGSLLGAPETFNRVRAWLDEIELPSSSDGPVAWEKTGEEVGAEMDRLAMLAEDPDLGRSEFSTGWLDVDRLLSPVVPGAMIIIAGRPGMSKTTVAVNMAIHLAMEKNLPTLFFSLEMSRVEIGLKALCARAKLRGADIKAGTLSDEDWVKAAKYQGLDKDAPLDIDDTPAITTDYIDRELAAYVRRHGRAPVAFFVDHIGLLEERSGRSIAEKTETVSKRLKQLAKKYGTVCVALCQLNRGPENRPGKRPELADLRNSGSIEQDADVVALLFREDYYDKESTRAGELDFIIAKHRNGPTDTIVLAAQLWYSRITSMAVGV